MKRFKALAIVFTLLMVTVSFCYAESYTVATGGKDGFYNNGLFNIFSRAVKRASDDEVELERYAEKGTDGTKHNIKLVSKGEADIAFIQLGGLVLDPDDNVQVIGTVLYELAHLVVPKKGNVSDADDLESKKGYSLGFNTRSGSAVTWEVFCKVDKDYKNANTLDVTSGSRAIASMMQGKLDAYFFVSAPGTKAIKRVLNSGDVEFADCWDGDFDDYKFRDNRLYHKVKVGKKDGYGKNKFVTVAIPAVVVVNHKVINENPDLFDYLFDGTMATFKEVKAVKKFTYYPD